MGNPEILYRGISSANASINRSLKEIAKQAMVEKILFKHVAWHTFAIIGLQNGLPLIMISKLMAHANIRETQGYSKILDLAVEKAMEIFND